LKQLGQRAVTNPLLPLLPDDTPACRQIKARAKRRAFCFGSCTMNGFTGRNGRVACAAPGVPPAARRLRPPGAPAGGAGAAGVQRGAVLAAVLHAASSWQARAVAAPRLRPDLPDEPVLPAVQTAMPRPGRRRRVAGRLGRRCWRRHRGTRAGGGANGGAAGRRGGRWWSPARRAAAGRNGDLVQRPAADSGTVGAHSEDVAADAAARAQACRGDLCRIHAVHRFARRTGDVHA